MFSISARDGMAEVKVFDRDGSLSTLLQEIFGASVCAVSIDHSGCEFSVRVPRTVLDAWAELSARGVRVH